MSTRSHIGFYRETPMESQLHRDWDVLLYKHSDGYPEGTLPQLTEFCMLFNEHRGLRDTEYAGARCMQYLTNYADGDMRQWRKEQNRDEDISQWDFLGYGISQNFHSDIEFYYAVSPESIKVYEVGYKEINDTWKPTFKEIQTVSLKEEKPKRNALEQALDKVVAQNEKETKKVSKKRNKARELEHKELDKERQRLIAEKDKIDRMTSICKKILKKLDEMED